MDFDLDDEIALSSLERLIAMPSSPGRVRAVREVAGPEIYQAFVRTRAPRVGFASAGAIRWIAKAALKCAGIQGCAHHGAHFFRHGLATELLRSGATLSEIGQLLRHESHDTTRINTKVDTEALRTLSLPWPGGASWAIYAVMSRLMLNFHEAALLGHEAMRPCARAQPGSLGHGG